MHPVSTRAHHPACTASARPAWPPQAVKLPDERDKFLYFVAAITFLAGFSERRAQDILVRASPLGGDKPSEQTASPPPR